MRIPQSQGRQRTRVYQQPRISTSFFKALYILPKQAFKVKKYFHIFLTILYYNHYNQNFTFLSKPKFPPQNTKKAKSAVT
jgi:hypothetical protein